MDQVNEQQEVAREVADAIANPLGAVDSPINDADLEKELEELEQEELNRALLQVDITTRPAADIVSVPDEGSSSAATPSTSMSPINIAG